MFLIYIKDLEDVLDLVLALYADDLVLWVTRSDIYHAASDMRIRPKESQAIQTYLELKSRHASKAGIQTGTTTHRHKQITRSHYKEECLNEWPMGTTGRAMFRHMTALKVKDDIIS